MSGEFHETSHSFLWAVLASADYDRPETGEPVADAIRNLCMALAPIERAVAWHQAHDSGLDYVISASAKNGHELRSAAEKLIRATTEYERLVERLVKDHAGSVSA